MLKTLRGAFARQTPSTRHLSSKMAATTPSGRQVEIVWDYPRWATNGLPLELTVEVLTEIWYFYRPAKAEPTKDRLQVIWKAANGEETVIADTTQGYRVLETTHPPTCERTGLLRSDHRQNVYTVAIWRLPILQTTFPQAM